MDGHFRFSPGEKGLKEYKTLFDKHSKRLFIIACRHVAPYEAEDIIQDLFIGLWEKRNALQIRTSWESYLYAVLKYQIYKFLDKQNQTTFGLNSELMEIGTDDELLSFEALYLQLDEGLSTLSPQCRVIFEKKYYQDKTTREIANELSISTETVKTQLKRGLKNLRDHMKEALPGFLFI